VEAIAGREAALAVARIKGGVNGVYIPTPDRLKSDHWLVRAVGLSAARLVAAAEGGLRYDIPRGPLSRRNLVSREIERLLGEGKSGAEIALLVGVDQRTVRRHKNRPSAHAAARPTLAGRQAEIRLDSASGATDTVIPARAESRASAKIAAGRAWSRRMACRQSQSLRGQN
jgi:hypothetical protein